MERRMLSHGEADLVAYNIREIEKCLGGPIPPGTLDATRYSDRILSHGDAYCIAQNIRQVTARNRRAQTVYRSVPSKPKQQSTNPGANLLTIITMAGLIAGWALMNMICG